MLTRRRVLWIDEAITTAPVNSGWIDVDDATGLRLDHNNRTVMVFSNDTSIVKIEGSMDGVTSHRTMVAAQAVTANTAYTYDLSTGASNVFRFYKITVTPSSNPDTISGWLIGNHITGT